MMSLIGFFFILGLVVSTIVLALAIWLGAHVLDFTA